MVKENLIQTRSFEFALRILSLFLKENREYEIAAQLMKSGTSIGANVEEAIAGVSRKDFINKLGISLKEARRNTLLAQTT